MVCGDLHLSSLPRTLYLNQGDELHLPCTIMGQGFNLLANPVIWYKVRLQAIKHLSFFILHFTQVALYI